MFTAHDWSISKSNCTVREDWYTAIMKPKSPFNFTPEQLDELRESIRAYFLDELGMEISNLQIDLFLDFVNEKVGRYYYNAGIADAIASMRDKTEDLAVLLKD